MQAIAKKSNRNEYHEVFFVAIFCRMLQCARKLNMKEVIPLHSVLAEINSTLLYQAFGRTISYQTLFY